MLLMITQWIPVLTNHYAGQYSGVKGYVACQVKVIFSLPPEMVEPYIALNRPRPRWYAYVEWFSKFAKQPHSADHGLYRVTRNKGKAGEHLGDVIPLGNIRRSLHLFPNFGSAVPQHWTSSNVLDLCDIFFTSDTSDKHAYETIK